MLRKDENQYKVTRLGDIAEIKGRIGWRGLKRNEYTDEGPILLSIGNITEAGVDFQNVDHLSWERYYESPEITIRPMDIIMGKDGTLGKVAIIDSLPYETTISSTLAKIRVTSNLVDPVYLFYYLKSDLFQIQVKSYKTGSTVPHFVQKNIRNAEVPLPPISIQIKVVNILKKVAELKQKREQANQMANNLLQAIFMQMFGDPQFNPYNWKKKSMGEIAEVRGRIGWMGLTTKDYRDNGPILIGVGNITKNHELDLNKIKRITRERYEEAPKIKVKNGDILLAKSGATTGKSCVVEDLQEEATVNAAVNIIRGKQEVNNYYLNYFIATRYCQSIIGETSPGSAQPNLFQRDTKKIEVPVPPIELQNQFVIVARKMKSIKEKQNQSTKEVTTLFNSLSARVMSKAFKGELVTEEA
jgi:type I restriction enzyme S subunit